VAADQQDWVDHLELAEFCYNNSEHSATGSTPFQIVATLLWPSVGVKPNT